MKFTQFARNRRLQIRKFADFTEVQVPPEVERFFQLAEAGDLHQLTNAFAALKTMRDSDPRESFRILWPALTETVRVAEAVRDWPAQKLLDYGNGILGALRPGMVYVSGTDAGHSIPTLLNETTEGEGNTILSQKSFADYSYIEYTRFLHGEKLETLSKEDSQRAFAAVLADLQKRYQHDTDFPNEPKQLRPGENVSIDAQNGEHRWKISGEAVVGAINGRMLQTLLDKNPDVGIALQQPIGEFRHSNPSRTGEILELQTPEEFRDWIKQWQEAKK